MVGEWFMLVHLQPEDGRGYVVPSKTDRKIADAYGVDVVHSIRAWNEARADESAKSPDVSRSAVVAAGAWVHLNRNSTATGARCCASRERGRPWRPKGHAGTASPSDNS